MENDLPSGEGEMTWPDLDTRVPGLKGKNMGQV